MENILKTGDIILVGGNKWLSRQIKNFTKSDYNHIGIIYRCYDEIFVVEQDRTGNFFNLDSRLITTNIKDYLSSGSDLLFRRPKFDVDGSEYGKLFLSQLGRYRYSYYDLLIAQPIYQLSGKGIWLGDKKIKNKRAVCSSYVAYVFNKMTGIYPDWYKKTPADFVNDENFLSL